MVRKKAIKAGIIGSGFAAKFHFDAIQRVFSCDVEVVGVYSKTPSRSKSFSKERGLKSFSSLPELIRASDIIHLCTPPVTHENIAVEVLKLDKDIIIEKPLTGYFGEGETDFSGDDFQKKPDLKKL
ncbi:Oxidoreductase family, NAD-binding Rossmann fold [Salegentibacter salinarum]|uniref:Gfo/Idh/MocA family protein n=1 Tax=Salegentibacter salinarum TaxID=447422 RepID=UPI0009C4DD60|nr:Gfo/Idh/MocA family oxidoreductase [Salegentibacter salinarum]SKB64334.1 Oxidoreductase family, NAD-binding Rossmann fold [Salegentibacter salinarum]